MGEHTVTSFDEELEHIDRLIRDMGDLACSMVKSSTGALVNSDNALAQRIISDDSVMDARQRELDEASITLIAKRQPMALDLRSVVGAIRMAADLERIGDLAKNIAKRVGAVVQTPTQKSLALSIEGMSEMVLLQIRGVVDAYVARDADVLRELRNRDEKIDISAQISSARMTSPPRPLS